MTHPDKDNKEAERAPGITDAEIAGIMGWRGPGAYTEATFRKIKRIIEEDRARRAPPALGEDGLPATIDTPEFQRLLSSYVDGVAGQWELILHINEQVRQAIAAYRAQLAANTPKPSEECPQVAVSVDTAELAALLKRFDYLESEPAKSKARAALIAHIDAWAARRATKEAP